LAGLEYRGVAQLASAPALGAGGRKFESSHPDQKGVAMGYETTGFGGKDKFTGPDGKEYSLNNPEEEETEAVESVKKRKKKDSKPENEEQ
jgi:hypothetical protein